MYSIDLFERHVVSRTRRLSGFAYRSAQMCHRSFINCPQELAIFVAHFARLLKSTHALFFKTSEVALNIPDVELEITSDKIRIFARGLRILGNEGPRWRIAGFGGDSSGKADEQKCSLCTSQGAQPEVAQTPYFLDQLHPISLFVE